MTVRIDEFECPQCSAVYDPEDRLITTPWADHYTCPECFLPIRFDATGESVSTKTDDDFPEPWDLREIL